MLTRFSDLDRTFVAMDDLRRRMDRMFGEGYSEGYPSRGVSRGGPFDDFSEQFGPRAGSSQRATLLDTQTALLFLAEVPGLSEKDVKISVNEDVLSVRGERRPDVLEGYSVHRSERMAFQFSRSVKLPAKIELDKISATLKDGILTVTLPKVPEAQPRQITVNAC